MKRISVFLTIIFSCVTIFGQVTFIITSLPENTPPEDIIYLAGDLNGWDPGNPDYALEINSDENWMIILPQEPQGTEIQFKFTRGDWNSVEKGANGEEIPNREFTYGNGDTNSVAILNWADLGGGGNTTAAENVSIIDNNFYMPQLDRTRRIWIYLPPEYNNSNTHYPVLYMHDGQNLFDAFTSFLGEWEIDETLNNLASEGYQVPIVVGIDNGGTERMNEYNPWVSPQYGGGQGDEYIDFLVFTLKPYIDENYRTLTGRENSGIMGSSMGGLISQYGALKFQDIFSKAGIFSPAYWTADSVWAFTNETGKQQTMKLYQLMGGQEGSGAIEDMWTMNNTLKNLGFNDSELLSIEVEGGQHNEAFWREQFADAYLWLYPSYANDIDEIITTREIEIIPNPVINQILIDENKIDKIDSLEIIDIRGRKVMRPKMDNKGIIDVNGLTPGSFILIMKSNEITYFGKFIKI